MGRNGSGVIIIDRWRNGRAMIGKRWQVRAWDPRKESYRTRSFLDGKYDDAERWGRDQSAKFRTGAERIDSPLLSLIGAEYARELEDRGRTARHVGEVRRIVTEVVRSGGDDMSAHDFPHRVRTWFSSLNMAAPTKNRFLAHLRAVGRYARAAGYTDSDPISLIRRHTVKLPAKAVFNLEELGRLVAPNDEPYWLPFALMAYTGCRHGEALHIAWDAVDWTAKRIHIRIHEDYALKRNKERAVPLQPELAAILLPRRQESGWIIADKAVRRANDKQRWVQFRAYVAKRGVTIGRRSPHSTRHDWVSLVIATGEDLFSVQEWAGHETLLTTQGYARSASAFRDAVTGWPKGVLRLAPAVASAAPQAAAPAETPQPALEPL